MSDDIRQEALRVGFDSVGITDASPIDAEQVELLAGWLKAGHAGQMGYMHRNFEKRISPADLVEGAKSVVCVGLNYHPPKLKAKKEEGAGPTGGVARYARYEDYHPFIKRQLRKLAEFMGSLAGGDTRFKICVDSAPVAERALAQRAGLGFIGKNHMLINPELGPEIFLGEIITDLGLESDELVAADCAGCNKCVEACPTGALRGDGQFDANKCISYLTIEHKGEIPADLATKVGDRLFGCDKCVLACPYQERAPACRNKQFKFYENRAQLNLNEVLDLSREEFEAKFSDSIIKRLGLERLKRNARICLMNIRHQTV
ncbi:MAG: tRNA epoxyqueuosine(34) reductase QueG [Planctomycetota bacterium]